MSDHKKEPRIKITHNGPYLVSGKVPLYEKIIVPVGKHYVLQDGRELPQSDVYALCRCGKSKNTPFCDGSHEKVGFVGEETASKTKYEDRADYMEGPGIDLLDDHRCALARFCHQEKGDAWELTARSDQDDCKKEAIQAACECPSGRLTAVEKTGARIEPTYEPSIEIIQDPEKGVSAGIFVKGNIPIESSDGETYEIRNRVALCRCGRSGNKPFCDVSHVSGRFKDKDKE
ncbi:CDGSH iron-sulfur domain-containing protein [Dehalobacterium formicoaceticum]|uniref:CDGSH iron-sulfur domain-containing protein n=1 Tax=Dehalobacterium formicoaceticum TaxID=51515 RepID=A0ABT1Y710_9FIRM|nr:CDGSH iron-sulfur domain-containing protein [Dehalobacterium formicoaceticum]MCR6546673.1 CDGSH iron-sulfur domain-containing protein [Dehalobacterium formicoaceticum]